MVFYISALLKYIFVRFYYWSCDPVFMSSLWESPLLVPALQSGCYDITWERCADLPSPMYQISAVLHDKKVYIIAGGAPDDDTLDQIYCYNVTTNKWEQLPPPGHYYGIIEIIEINCNYWNW